MNNNNVVSFVLAVFALSHLRLIVCDEAGGFSVAGIEKGEQPLPKLYDSLPFSLEKLWNSLPKFGRSTTKEIPDCPNTAACLEEQHRFCLMAGPNATTLYKNFRTTCTRGGNLKEDYTVSLIANSFTSSLNVSVVVDYMGQVTIPIAISSDNLRSMDYLVDPPSNLIKLRIATFDKPPAPTFFDLLIKPTNSKATLCTHWVSAGMVPESQSPSLFKWGLLFSKPAGCDE